MRYQFVSDIHLEQRETFEIKCHAPYLIMAGDILPLEQASDYQWFFDQISKSFENIIYVFGNHEFYSKYRTPIETLKANFHDFIKAYPKVIVLDNEMVRIAGDIIIGSTLWSQTPENPTVTTNDYEFVHVYDKENDKNKDVNNSGVDSDEKVDGKQEAKSSRKITTSDTNKWHQESVSYLHDTLIDIYEQDKFLDSAIIVVTHFAPLMKGTSNPKFEANKSREMNLFFASDQKTLLDRFVVDIWIFGHTHFATAHHYLCTLIASNPLGYRGENTGHNSCLVVDACTIDCVDVEMEPLIESCEPCE